jgi:hypothetical protein
MCSHARCSRQLRAISGTGSNAPVWIPPAWAQTIVGPVSPAAGRAQRVGAHAATVVGRYDLDAVAQPEQPAGEVDGGAPPASAHTPEICKECHSVA